MNLKRDNLVSHIFNDKWHPLCKSLKKKPPKMLLLYSLFSRKQCLKVKTGFKLNLRHHHDLSGKVT